MWNLIYMCFFLFEISSVFIIKYFFNDVSNFVWIFLVFFFSFFLLYVGKNAQNFNKNKQKFCVCLYNYIVLIKNKKKLIFYWGVFMVFFSNLDIFKVFSKYWKGFLIFYFFHNLTSKNLFLTNLFVWQWSNLLLFY